MSGCSLADYKDLRSSTKVTFKSYNKPVLYINCQVRQPSSTLAFGFNADSNIARYFNSNGTSYLLNVSSKWKIHH